MQIIVVVVDVDNNNNNNNKGQYRNGYIYENMDRIEPD